MPSGHFAQQGFESNLMSFSSSTWLRSIAAALIALDLLWLCSEVFPLISAVVQSNEHGVVLADAFCARYSSMESDALGGSFSVRIAI
jgi:hypothetical protein